MSKDRIAIISHSRALEHVMPFPRPHLESFENPLRLQMAQLYLKQRGLLERYRTIKAVRAKEKSVRLVHSAYHIDSVKLMARLGSGQIGESAYASPEVFVSSLYAVGAAIQAAELIAKGNAKHVFSMMRPPGHHASSSMPMGLCYFNNLAVASRHLKAEHGVRKISILDFDSHFGNGTAEIFYADPYTQYISIHEYDYENYGIGHYDEIGYGDAAGTNVNIPLVDLSPDLSYREAFDRLISPAISSFEPEIIAVSAGFDAHFTDPVGNMNVDSRTFWEIGRKVDTLVTKTGAHGSFWVLEGGYNPLALGPSIEASLEGLSSNAEPKLEDRFEREVHEHVINANSSIIDHILEIFNPFW